MTLRDVCINNTDLCEKDIKVLEQVSLSLGHISDLFNGDTFIDCMSKEGVAIIVAEKQPTYVPSTYSNSVIGHYAKRRNEPAVYSALSLGIPVYDTKAITQENKTVSQNVVPIKNDNITVGVLICERDVSRIVQLEKKYSEMQRLNEEPRQKNHLDESLYVHEVHHRVKNNLQAIASINNLRIRNTENEEIRQALRENAEMILTVAALHDILSVKEDVLSDLSLSSLLEKVIKYTLSLTPKGISVNLTGDDILIHRSKATFVALVVSELINNSVSHAFPNNTGRITVTLGTGNMFYTVTVRDNGCGIKTNTKYSTGIRIASTIVTEKLDGELTISSSSDGTKVLFSIKR